MERSEIIKAYVFLRENNHDISDETLDFMKDSSLCAYDSLHHCKMKTPYLVKKGAKEAKNNLNDAIVALEIVMMKSEQANPGGANILTAHLNEAYDYLKEANEWMHAITE